MNIKDMKLATGSGTTVAYFRVEWPGYMVINECKLIEGKNGLFAGMPQKEYTAAGVKKYKALVYLEKPLHRALPPFLFPKLILFLCRSNRNTWRYLQGCVFIEKVLNIPTIPLNRCIRDTGERFPIGLIL